MPMPQYSYFRAYNRMRLSNVLQLALFCTIEKNFPIIVRYLRIGTGCRHNQYQIIKIWIKLHLWWMCEMRGIKQYMFFFMILIFRNVFLLCFYCKHWLQYHKSFVFATKFWHHCLRCYINIGCTKTFNMVSYLSY